MTKVKRGRHRIISQGYRDEQIREPMMSMDRDATYRAFEAREIPEDDPIDRRAANRQALEQVQSRYHNRRIR